MTILHVNIDEDDNDNNENSDDTTIYATKTITHQKKTIPQWARSKCRSLIVDCNDHFY
jgi:hypothetical protein